MNYAVSLCILASWWHKLNKNTTKHKTLFSFLKFCRNTLHTWSRLFFRTNDNNQESSMSNKRNISVICCLKAEQLEEGLEGESSFHISLEVYTRVHVVLQKQVHKRIIFDSRQKKKDAEKGTNKGIECYRPLRPDPWKHEMEVTILSALSASMKVHTTNFLEIFWNEFSFLLSATRQYRQEIKCIYGAMSTGKMQKLQIKLTIIKFCDLLWFRLCLKTFTFLTRCVLLIMDGRELSK